MLWINKVKIFLVTIYQKNLWFIYVIYLSMNLIK